MCDYIDHKSFSISWISFAQKSASLSFVLILCVCEELDVVVVVERVYSAGPAVHHQTLHGRGGVGVGITEPPAARPLLCSLTRATDFPVEQSRHTQDLPPSPDSSPLIYSFDLPGPTQGLSSNLQNLKYFQTEFLENRSIYYLPSKHNGKLKA